MTTKPVRSHETSIEIDAPIEEVWKALSDATEISRWFAPKMTIEPGVGGFMIADWGPGVEWKTAIEVWEPNQHMRLAEIRDKVMSASPVEQPLEPCRLVQDFYLEGKGGKTVLRLVHSGFGTSKAWDQEYEGTRGGWAACFLRLKHGMERHRNDTVHNSIMTTLCAGVSPKQALERIEAGAPERIHVQQRSEYEVCGFLPDHNSSVFTLSCQPAGTDSMAYVEFLLYGMSDAPAKEVEDKWRSVVSRLFPKNTKTIRA